MSLGSFKNVIDKMCLQIVYLMYMYKEGLALNSLQWFIRHESKLTTPPKKLGTNSCLDIITYSPLDFYTSPFYYIH